MKSFFILGLPRSRTAWLANLLTTEKVHCFHDLLGLLPFPELKTLFKQSNKEYTGATGTLPFDFGVLKGYFPDTPIVVIERPLDECYASTLKAWGFLSAGKYKAKVLEVLNAQQKILELVKQDPNALVEDFHKLDDDAIRRIWRHCAPTIEPDMFRIRQLGLFQIVFKHSEEKDMMKAFKDTFSFYKGAIT
jgi:hypothetical protein